MNKLGMLIFVLLKSQGQGTLCCEAVLLSTTISVGVDPAIISRFGLVD